MSACIPAGEGLRRLLATPASAPPWSRVLDFAAAWSEPASPLARVPFIWLEFDLDGASTPAPFVVFYVQPSHYRRDRAPSEAPWDGSLTSAEMCRPILQRALAALLGRALDPAVERGVFACLAALPEGGFLTYAAPLASRGVNAVRLNVAVPHGRVLDYLRDIAWPGPTSELSELLRDLPMPPGVPPGTLWFDLDVGADVLPTIKVDYHYPERDPAWTILLARLVERGLCAPGQRDAALGWPGSTPLVLPGMQRPCALHRGLTIKLVCRSGAPVQAKAYLDFACRFTLFS